MVRYEPNMVNVMINKAKSFNAEIKLSKFSSLLILEHFKISCLTFRSNLAIVFKIIGNEPVVLYKLHAENHINDANVYKRLKKKYKDINVM